MLPGFFHLDSGTSMSRLAEWARGEVDLETVICPVDDGHQRSGKRLTDLSVILPGRTVEDIVWTWYSECLLTDRVLEMFRDKGFTGFEVQPVKTRYKRADEVPPRLWELVITGWAGMAPPESGIKLVEECHVCGYKAYSGWTRPETLVPASQWDGSDFFMVWPLPKYIFITERVAQAIREARLSGGVLTPLEGLVASQNASLGPGRLSYHMPEQRAMELGGPLGIY
jgi:hypothetical protein